MGNKSKINIPVQQETRCPIMFRFTNIEQASKSLAKQHTLLNPENQNISNNQKNLLR